jgi:hypothetical protein
MMVSGYWEHYWEQGGEQNIKTTQPKKNFKFLGF